MTAPKPITFTAAQIARACSVSRQCAQTWLRSVPRDGLQLISGQEANAWRFDSLPPRLQADLQRFAKSRGFRSVELLLQDAPEPWRPPKPLDQVPQKFKSRAAELRNALAPFLARQHDTSTRQLAQEGLAEYQRVVGHAISAKTWLRLLVRATKRDGGAENWQRLDLYIDDAAFQNAAPAPAARLPWSHAELKDAFDQVEDKTNPTLEDRAFFFHDVFRHYETLEAAHPGRDREIKPSLLAHILQLLPAPALAKTPSALTRKFEYKLNQWRDGGRTPDALMDNRRVSSGNFRTPDFSTDLREIAKRAVQLDGNESGARRRLEAEGKLSEEFRRYYPFDPRRDKSALPNKVRKSVTPLVDATLPYRRGPKAVRDAGPHITRDWSNVRPGDWFVLDDVTWNHLFKVPLPNGKWDVRRGECLVAIDEKSDYPLDFLLIPGKYNGLHIRQLVSKIHDRLGLPRVGLTLERGVWKSRFVVGDPEKNWQPLRWRYLEAGLSDPRIGLRIHHATVHRAKVIEGFFHHLQDRMRDIPGFVGFNEREYRMQTMQALIARARNGDAEALAAFPTQEQWRDKIRSVMEEHRNEPGNGVRLGTESPAEAWNKSQLALSLKKLPDDARHLLSTHEKIVRLTPKGLLISLPGNEAVICFCNEHTDRLLAKGETHVRALVNLEAPEQITCFDMKGQTRFAVRGQIADAKNAPPEQRAELAQMRRAHRASAKALFGEIQHDVRSTITRDSDIDAATLEEGRFHNDAAEQHKAQESEEQKLKREIRGLREKLGKPPLDFSTCRVPIAQLAIGLRAELDIVERRRSGAQAHTA